jgi:hypothetical protein
VSDLAARVLVVVAGGVLGGFVLSYVVAGAGPRDAVTYLAAAERLASGGDLYALGAGDRPVDQLSQVPVGPLLYPPLIAVLWLPLTLVPGSVALAAWWAATVSVSVAVIAALVRRRPVMSAFAIILLVVPLTYLLTVGNVDAFVILAAVAAWLLTRRGSPDAAGAIVGFLTVVKVTSLILGVWVVVTAPRRGSLGLLAGLAAGLAIGLLGAGLDAHLRYVEVIRSLTQEPGNVVSIATILRAAGVSAEIALGLHGIIVAAGLAVVVLLRDRPGLSFAITIALLAVGTPVVNIGSPAILIAALAPLAWPWPGPASSPITQVASDPPTVLDPDPLPSVPDTP